MRTALVSALVVVVALSTPVGAVTKQCRQGRTCTGTDDDDHLVGTKRADVMYGLNGNDDLDGNGGADEVNGGKARDDVVGGIGDDQVNGDDGGDSVEGGQGDDLLNGGKGRNDIYIFRVDFGRDRIAGRSPNGVKDEVKYFAWKDLEVRLHSSNKPEVKEARGGTVDWVNNVIDSISTGRGDDEIHGDRFDNYISPGEGSDIVYAGSGSDWIAAAFDDDPDTINCGDGKDTVEYEADDDTTINCENLRPR